MTEIREAQNKLAMLWCFWGGFIFLMLFTYQLNGTFDDGDFLVAWKWFSAAVFPTPALIFSSIIASPSDKVNNSVVPTRIYYLTLGFSVFYLIVLTVIVFSKSLQISSTPTIEQMENSWTYLGLVNGLLSASMGIFFAKRSME